jgi:hypothetical protein
MEIKIKLINCKAYDCLYNLDSKCTSDEHNITPMYFSHEALNVKLRCEKFIVAESKERIFI